MKDNDTYKLANIYDAINGTPYIESTLINEGFKYNDLLLEEKEDLTARLVNSMYDELRKNIKEEDSLGLWIEYNGEVLENAIKLSVLGDMIKYGAKDIDPIYEFFKMTINEPDPEKGNGEKIEPVV